MISVEQTVQIAQMATLDADQLKIILPTMESFPRWISFTDFERVKVFFILYVCSNYHVQLEWH